MKKNAASQIIGAEMITAADGSAFTGSVTVYYTIDGGSQTIGSVGSGVCTHEGNGLHTYTPTQGETNGDHIAWTFIGTGAISATVQVYPSFPQTVDNNTILAHGSYGNAQLVRSTTPANTLSVDVSNRIGGIAGTLNTLDDLDTAQDLEHAITQDLVGNISSGSGAIGQNATGFTPTSVTQTLTYTATEQEDGTLHELEPSGGTLDCEYLTTLPDSGAIAAVSLFLYVAGNGDSVALQFWDWTDSSYKTELTQSGSNGTTLIPLSIPANAAYTGTGANLGEVKFRVFSDGGSVVTKVAIDRLRFEYTIIQTVLGFEGGAVWYDDINGEPGTLTGIGKINRPSSVEADAKTIADDNNLKRIHCRPGSTFILEENMDSFEFIGHAYSVSLAAQSIDGTYFFDANTSGTFTYSSNPPIFEDCPIGDIIGPPSILRRCYLFGDIVNTGVGDWFINHCVSRKAGGAAVNFNFGTAVGNTNLNLRSWAGRIQLEAMGNTGTDAVEAEGWGEIIEGTCAGGNVTISGNMTTAGVTNLTLLDDARIDVDQINTEADTALSDFFNSSDQLVQDFWNKVLSKANFNVGQSGAKMLREIFAGAVAAEGAVSGTPTTTTFTTNITGFGDNFFRDQRVQAYNGAAMAGQSRVVSSYTSLTGVFVVDEPFTTALSSGDDVTVSVPHVHSLTQIVVAVVEAIGARTPSAQIGAPTTYDGLMYFIRQSLKNRLRYDKGTDTMYLYEDDGTTVKFTFPMTDDASDAERGAGS
jgi:hypothetical protein